MPVLMFGAEFTFDGHFYEVNALSGSLRAITTNSGGFYSGMDFDPTTGILWACSSTRIYTVDPATGRPLTSRSLAGTTTLVGPNSISFAPDGTLYGLGNNDGNLYRIDKVSATATLLGTSGQTLFGLEFGPGGKLYGVGNDLFEINPYNGAATNLGRLTSTSLPALFLDLDFASNGLMYGVTGDLTTASLYTIDLSTATATVIGPTGGDVKSIASVPELVPEPGSSLLLAFGALSMMSRRVRVSGTV